MTKPDDRRRQEIAKIQIGRQKLALTDDSYRDLLQVCGGARSAKDLTDDGRTKVIERFKELGAYKDRAGKTRAPARAGTRPLADGPQAAMARALWVGLFHLGVVRNPEEAALDAYAKRVVRVDTLSWCSAQQLSRVIEGLKDMGARNGVVWSRKEPKRSVAEAIWSKLDAAGARPALNLETYSYQSGFKPSFVFFTGADWDRLIERLGELLRAAPKATAPAEPAEVSTDA
jgi:phage gp16-like protein